MSFLLQWGHWCSQGRIYLASAFVNIHLLALLYTFSGDKHPEVAKKLCMQWKGLQSSRIHLQPGSHSPYGLALHLCVIKPIIRLLHLSAIAWEMKRWTETMMANVVNLVESRICWKRSLWTLLWLGYFITETSRIKKLRQGPFSQNFGDTNTSAK